MLIGTATSSAPKGVGYDYAEGEDESQADSG